RVAGGTGCEQPEGRREDRAGPLLRIAEERPRPLSADDPPDREIRKLGLDRLDLRRHQVQERPLLEAERLPVELGMDHEPEVIVPALAREADAEDGGMRRSGQALDLPER